MKDTGLTEKEWEQIRSVLCTVPAIEKAVLFGSRAMGVVRGNSDVDIMLYGEKLTSDDVVHARALLEEMILPYSFDLVLCEVEDEVLQEHVRCYGKVIFEKNDYKRILRERWENAGGCLPVNWDITSFGEILLTPKSISVGVMYPGTNTIGGIPLIKIGDINDGFIQKPNFCISHEVNREYNRTQLFGDELLITLVGNPGECVVVDKSMAGWNVARAIACAKISNPDIRYYVKCIVESKPGKSIIDGYLNTTVQKTLNLKELRQLPIPLPSQKEIKSIVGFAFKTASRIQLLRETNATLEAIAKALFKSWFVDFDPVHAKAEGRIPEGMDAETAALFPSEFEESELGMIPKGWKVAPLGEHVTITGGGTPSTKNPDYWMPEEHAWTSPKDLSGLSSPILLSTEKKISSAGLVSVSSGLLPAGTLLLSSRAPIGYLAITRIPAAINQGYIAVLPNSELPPLFMYFWCILNMGVIKGHANGSTFMEISKKSFRLISAIIPDPSLVRACLPILHAVFESIANNEKQARTLTALRNTLLPRLISGKLRLPEFAETADGAAV